MSTTINRLALVSLVLISIGFIFRPLVTSADDNLPPVADAGPDIETSEAGYASFTASASTDPDGQGDIVSYAWDFGDGGTGGSYNESHSYVEDGIYTVTLTVTDSEAHTDSDTIQVTVDNVAVSIGSFNPNVPEALINELISVQASFADQGVTDTHTATVDWGDESSSEGVITEDNGSGNVFGSHSYENPGEYTITLTVTDSDNASEQSTTTITIVEE